MNLLEDYIDKPALAAELKRTQRTLERWERLGIGPPVTRIERQVLYYIPSVQEWLRSRERKMPRERRRAS